MATKVEVSDNWQSERTALQCNAYMFDNFMATDVTFVVSNAQNRTGSGVDDQLKEKSRTIKAHKYILASRSPVFWKMFHGELPETKSEIIVSDVDPDAFIKVLRYLYTEEIELDPELVMFIVYIAKKYMLTILRTKCTEYLEEQLSPQNAVTLLDHSLFFDNKELTAKSLRMVRRETVSAISSSYIVHIRKSTLDLILSEQSLTAEEIQIFQACERWADQKCKEEGIEVCGSNMRRMLGETLYKIRFPLIPIDTFNSIVASSEILPLTDESKLFRYMAPGSSKSKKDIPYSFEQRYLKGQSKSLLCKTEEHDMKEIEITSMSFSLEIESESVLNIQGLYICGMNVKHVNQMRQTEQNLEVSVDMDGRQLLSNSTAKEDVDESKYVKIIRLNDELTGKKQALCVQYNNSNANFYCRNCGRTYNNTNYSYHCPSCRRQGYSQALPVTNFKLPILMKSEIILTDDFVSVKIKSAEKSHMPIVGLLYML